MLSTRRRRTRRRSTRRHGVLVYVETGGAADTLAWIGPNGESVTESQLQVLRAAACGPEEPALPRADDHHDLVRSAVEHLIGEHRRLSGQLGRPSDARFRTYERLKNYAADVSGTLFDTDALKQSLDDIYRLPLRASARETLNRLLRAGITDDALAELVVEMRDAGRLCVEDTDGEDEAEPTVICSLGLRAEP